MVKALAARAPRGRGRTRLGIGRGRPRGDVRPASAGAVLTRRSKESSTKANPPARAVAGPALKSSPQPMTGISSASPMSSKPR